MSTPGAIAFLLVTVGPIVILAHFMFPHPH